MHTIDDPFSTLFPLNIAQAKYWIIIDAAGAGQELSSHYLQRLWAIIGFFSVHEGGGWGGHEHEEILLFLLLQIFFLHNFLVSPSLRNISFGLGQASTIAVVVVVVIIAFEYEYPGTRLRGSLVVVVPFTIITSVTSHPFKFMVLNDDRHDLSSTRN